MAKLDRRLEKAFERVVERVGRLLEDKASSIMITAQRNAPVRTGALRQSIRYTREGDLKQGSVIYRIIAGGSNAPYAALVEFGVGRRGAAGLTAEGQQFLPSGWKYGGRAGFPGRLYMTRAYFAHARDIEGEISKLVEDELRATLEGS